jgi:hypothetical protein
LLIDEFNKDGTEVRFVKARKVETPEDELLLQFQGMFAEYERNADIGISFVMPTPRLCRLAGQTSEGMGLIG